MLVKNYLLPMFVAAIVFAGTAGICPVYAQDGNSDSNGGFFGGVGRFFSRMFGGEDSPKQQPKPAQQKVQQKNEEKVGSPAANQKLMMPKDATTGGKMIPGEEGRLNALVAQGKITQAQKTAILAKIKSLQEELKSWATSEGIDPQYVVLPGGPMPVNMIKEGSPSGMQKPERKEGQESMNQNKMMMQRPNKEPQKQN